MDATARRRDKRRKYGGEAKHEASLTPAPYPVGIIRALYATRVKLTKQE